MNATELAVLKQLILLCLKPAERSLPANESEWEELVRLAAYHGVASLLWVLLKDRTFSQAIRARLWALYALNLSRNQALKAEQKELLAALAARQIPVWPLKGVHLSEMLYQDVGAREVADVDILIRPADLERVDQLLRELGYQRSVADGLTRLRDIQEVLYQKKTAGGLAVALDLHQRLLPYVKHDPLAERVWADGMTRANLLLYLCANHVAHRFARLKFLVDLTRLLDRAGEELDWNAVVRGAREIEFASGIYYSLSLAAELTPGRVPEGALAELRPSALERRFARWVLGRDAVSVLARGPRLEGPYGSFAILASTRGWPGRVRQAGRLLFPPAAYMRQQYLAPPQQPTLPLYLSRLLEKIPLAIRDLVKAVF